MNPGKSVSSTRRLFAVIRFIVQGALLLAALADIAQRPAEEINGDKRRWFAFLFTPFIGPIGYLIFGRKQAQAEIPATTPENRLSL
jgi:ABC-type cobalt transport system substrate-binding protein